jgi:hypothetical protein
MFIIIDLNSKAVRVAVNVFSVDDTLNSDACFGDLYVLGCLLGGLDC